MFYWSLDVVNQGSGTTNDGNTSRTFFANPEITALATGVDVNLIHRFTVILQAITSGLYIDCEKFERYAKAKTLCSKTLCRKIPVVVNADNST